MQQITKDELDNIDSLIKELKDLKEKRNKLTAEQILSEDFLIITEKNKKIESFSITYDFR